MAHHPEAFSRREIPKPILDAMSHNGQKVGHYPSDEWNLVPFPADKGMPFNFDNLATVNDFSFMAEDRFLRAREAADKRWHPHGRNISWRLHTYLWAAQTSLASQPGSTWVELGCGKGYMATAILTYLDQNPESSLPDRFVLFDRFSMEYGSETAGGASNEPKEGEGLFYYTESSEEVAKHFSNWSFVEVVIGNLPGSLGKVPLSGISFVHIDLNNPQIEVESLEMLTPALLQGALLLFDDSGNPGCRDSLDQHKHWSSSYGLPFLQLPTGQGFVIWNDGRSR